MNEICFETIVFLLYEIVIELTYMTIGFVCKSETILEPILLATTAQPTYFFCPFAGFCLHDVIENFGYNH